MYDNYFEINEIPTDRVYPWDQDQTFIEEDRKFSFEKNPDFTSWVNDDMMETKSNTKENTNFELQNKFEGLDLEDSNSVTIMKDQSSIVQDEKQPNNMMSISERKKMKDGIYKKCKTHFLKWLKNQFRKELRKNKLSFNLKISQLKPKPLPNLKFNSNVTYDFNRRILKMTLKEIYSTKWGKLANGNFTNQTESGNFKKNTDLLKHIYEKKINSLTKFLNKTLEYYFVVYLNTDYFIDKEKIREKQCTEICISQGCVECRSYMEVYSAHIEGLGKENGILNDFLYTPGNNSKKSSRKICKKSERIFDVIKICD